MTDQTNGYRTQRYDAAMEAIRSESPVSADERGADETVVFVVFLIMAVALFVLLARPRARAR